MELESFARTFGRADDQSFVKIRNSQDQVVLNKPVHNELTPAAFTR